MRWLISITLFAVLVLLFSCAPGVPDKELEAQLQNLSDEELQKVIAESEQEQSKALAGQAYQRNVQIGGKSFSQKEVSKAAYKVAYQKGMPAPDFCQIRTVKDCIDNAGHILAYLTQCDDHVCGGTKQPAYPYNLLLETYKTTPITPNQVLCCTGQGIGTTCGADNKNALFLLGTEVETVEKDVENKVTLPLNKPENPSASIPVCLSGATCQWSEAKLPGYDFVIGYSTLNKGWVNGYLRGQEDVSGVYLFEEKSNPLVNNVNLYCKPAASPSIPVIPLPLCGDNKCEAGEDKSCPKDCKPLLFDIKPLLLPAKSCGNKICEINQETPKSCPQDCNLVQHVALEKQEQQGPSKGWNLTSCTDSDGKNYQVKGSVLATQVNPFDSKLTLEVEDTCVSDKKMIEFFCDEQKELGIGEEEFDCTSLGKQYRCIESYQPPYGFLGKCSASWCAPPSGLISWWPAENTGNDVQNNNHGILQNDVTFTEGVVGKSFAFDSLDKYGVVHSGDGYVEYIEIPDHPSLTPAAITIEGWVYVSSFAPNQIDHRMIVSKSDGVQQKSYYLSASQDGVVHFTVAGNVAIRTQNKVLSVNKWHHVAAVYEQGAAYKIYIDGSEAPIVAAPPQAAVSDSTVPLIIGASVDAQNTPKEFWHGLIDELSIYNRALSAGEIWAVAISGAQNVGKCT